MALAAVPAAPAGAPPAPDAAGPGPHVDFGASAGERTPGLLGVSQVPDDEATAEAMAGDPVPSIRVDAYLDRGIHPEPGVYDFSALDARLDRAETVGAEPVLILSYMPPWMSSCRGEPLRTASRCPPADLGEWHRLVEATVTHALDRGVTRFEVWNEPDNPLFFQGTPADYLEMYGAAARAVEDVEAETGVDLQVGGPATVGPDPVYIQGLLEHARIEGLPVDFVSWHWYANSPFIGAFDHEGLPTGTPGALDQESPVLDPRHYRVYTEMVRSWVASARLQGLASDPGIWVTEWNVNAGDDPRHRSHVGAAFAAASLIQMEAADLNRAYYFNAQGESWGMYGPDGEARPVRDAYRLVGDLPGGRVEADPGAHRSHLHVLAAGEDGGDAGAVLANVHGSHPRTLDVTLTVEGAPGPLAGVEAVTGPGDEAGVTPLDDDGPTRRYHVHLPAQSVLQLAWDGGD